MPDRPDALVTRTEYVVQALVGGHWRAESGITKSREDAEGRMASLRTTWPQTEFRVASRVVTQSPWAAVSGPYVTSSSEEIT